jgi:hypothetical protein
MSNGVLTAQLNAAMAAVTATMASVPSILDIDTDTLVTLQQQIATALSYAQQVLSAYDTLLAGAGAPANFASGTPPVTMTANVNALLAYSTAINYAFDCVSKLGRLSKNVAALTTG